MFAARALRRHHPGTQLENDVTSRRSRPEGTRSKDRFQASIDGVNALSNTNPQTEAVFNRVSKLMRLMHWFCYTSLRDWSRNLVPPSQPIKCRTRTSYDLVARAFPRFREFSFTFRSYGLLIVFVGHCHWLGFAFTSLSRKTL